MSAVAASLPPACGERRRTSRAPLDYEYVFIRDLIAILGALAASGQRQRYQVGAPTPT